VESYGLKTMQREYKKHGFFSFVPSDSRRNRELWCLKHGESGINSVGRVMEVSRKGIKTKEGEEKVVLSGIVADYTAKIPFFSWEEREELVKDKIVQIENAYLKRWNGLPTLHIGKNTSVSIVENYISFPSWTVLMKPKKRAIGEILNCEGAFDVILEGDIVSVSQLRDEGNRKRIVLDDGTGALFMEFEEQKKEQEADISFGMPVRARGNVVAVESKNGLALKLIAEKVKISREAFMIRELRNFLSRYA